MFLSRLFKNFLNPASFLIMWNFQEINFHVNLTAFGFTVSKIMRSTTENCLKWKTALETTWVGPRREVKTPSLKLTVRAEKTKKIGQNSPFDSPGFESGNGFTLSQHQVALGNSTLDPTMAGEGRKMARGSWGESERLLRSEKKTGGGEGVTFFGGMEVRGWRIISLFWSGWYLFLFLKKVGDLGVIHVLRLIWKWLFLGYELTAEAFTRSSLGTFKLLDSRPLVDSEYRCLNRNRTGRPVQQRCVDLGGVLFQNHPFSTHHFWVSKPPKSKRWPGNFLGEVGLVVFMGVFNTAGSTNKSLAGKSTYMILDGYLPIGKTGDFPASYVGLPQGTCRIIPGWSKWLMAMVSFRSHSWGCGTPSKLPI